MKDERMKRNEKAGQVVATHYGFDIIVADKETVYGYPYFEVIDPSTGKSGGAWYPTLGVAKGCATKLAKARKLQFDYKA